MDRNTPADNDRALNVAISSVVVIPPPIIIVPLTKPFLDIFKIEVFSGQNFRRWQEMIFNILDLHGMTWVVVDHKIMKMSKHGHIEIRFVDTLF